MEKFSKIKTLSVLLTVVVVSLAFTGCDGSNKDDGGTGPTLGVCETKGYRYKVCASSKGMTVLYDWNGSSLINYKIEPGLADRWGVTVRNKSDSTLYICLEGTDHNADGTEESISGGGMHGYTAGNIYPYGPPCIYLW